MECVSLPPLHSYKACRCKRCKGMVPVSTMQPGAKMQPELLGSCCLAASNAFRASLLSILSTQRRSVVPQKLALFLFTWHFLSPDIFPPFIDITSISDSRLFSSFAFSIYRYCYCSVFSPLLARLKRRSRAASADWDGADYEAESEG